MPSFNKKMVGGRAVSGNALNPRKHRGNTADINTFWSGMTPQQMVQAISNIIGGPSFVEYLVVAGGGGGGTGQNGLTRYQGGGGAGGYRAGSSLSLTNGTSYTVTVGDGGAAGVLGGGDGSNGANSQFATISATGGGGGNWGNGDGIQAPSGGSGGGGGGNSDYLGGAGNLGGYTPVEGYAGGNGNTSSPFQGGGGGGSGGAGGTTTGGAGTANTITGTSVTYAAGGAGSVTGAGTAGAANTGNGGSAGSNMSSSFRGGAGGSGFVCVAYSNVFQDLQITGSLTYTVDTSSRAGYKIYKFTAGTGTIVSPTGIPLTAVPIDFFVVGGGGGGAQGFNNGTVAASSYGGSGGGLSQVSTSNTSGGTYTITVGAGGSAGGTSGGNGGSSSVVLGATTIASATGGGGSTYGYPSGTTGAVGVGSTANGSLGVLSFTGAVGGTANSFTGTSVTYGAGQGYNGSGSGAAGTAETGMGGQGGGGGNPWAGGAGGSGVAYAKFLTADEAWFSYTGGTRSTTGSYTLIKWGTAGGTLTRLAVQPTTSYELITTVTVGAGGSSSITFSSIPQNYKHLQIRGIGRSDLSSTASQAQMQINGDTSSSSYAFHQVLSTGTAVQAYGYTTGTLPSMSPVLRSTGGTAGANSFGVTIIDILDYTSTNKYKTVRTLTGYSSSATGEVQHNSGVWLSTSAVTSLVISWQGGSGNFVQYSKFALYGIAG